MQLFSFILPLYASSAVAANIFGGPQHVMGSIDTLDNSVPGKNPLDFCEDPKDHILEIKTVDLEPNPPEAGKTLTIKAKGTFAEEVGKGAYVTIVVKYGLIKILTLKEDLCDQMKNVDKECPLKKGDTTITKDVELPTRIPPGTYSVQADVYTVDDKKVTCLEASIKFS